EDVTFVQNGTRVEGHSEFETREGKMPLNATTIALLLSACLSHLQIRSLDKLRRMLINCR
ncbi:MAG: hypothetical protein AAGK79_07980, partial [Pseudomonadota bacterium]